MLKQIQTLIDKGLNAYHISQMLKLRGKRVYCYGSYYVCGRACFYQTVNGGVKCSPLDIFNL